MTVEPPQKANRSGDLDKKETRTCKQQTQTLYHLNELENLNCTQKTKEYQKTKECQKKVGKNRADRLESDFLRCQDPT